MLLAEGPKQRATASAALGLGAPSLRGPPAWSRSARAPWGLQAGLEPGAHRGAVGSGAAAEPAPCETAASAPAGEDRGPGPRGNPRPQGALARRPRRPGRGPSPARCPGRTRRKRPAALASCPPSPSSAPPPPRKRISEMFCNELGSGKRNPKHSHHRSPPRPLAGGRKAPPASGPRRRSLPQPARSQGRGATGWGRAAAPRGGGARWGANNRGPSVVPREPGSRWRRPGPRPPPTGATRAARAGRSLAVPGLSRLFIFNAGCRSRQQALRAKQGRVTGGILNRSIRFFRGKKIALIDSPS